MKKAHLKELQAKLLGTVTDQADTLEFFSTDASIFQVMPTAVVYPQNTADVRKTVQYVADRVRAGKPLSVVPRGMGCSTTGAPLGEGIVISLPANMNRLLRLGQTTVTVQPGMSVATLQQTLSTHNRWVPPAGGHNASVGGAVAAGAASANSLKYGSLQSALKSLKVVLSDGSLIKTERLNARELNRKKGLDTLEGEIYRGVDSLLLDHAPAIKKRIPRVAYLASGYRLEAVRRRDGSFDLTPLFAGSEGTLGVITEVTLSTTPQNPRTTLVVGYCDSADHAASAIAKLRSLAPCALELIDDATLEAIREHRPADLNGFVPEKLPKIMLFVEFDDFSQLSQKFRSVRAGRILSRHKATGRVSTDPVEQVALWKLRRAAASAWVSSTIRQPLPFIDDAIVPPDKLPALMDKTAKLLVKYDLAAPVWGPAGAGALRLYPQLDLARKRDVDKLFNLKREYDDLVASLGGAPSSASGDGLLRAPGLSRLYGDEVAGYLTDTKRIFDPHGLLNPHRKTDASDDYAREHLRTEYSLARFSNHPLTS